jgi:hypothetical protein
VKSTVFLYASWARATPEWINSLVCCLERLNFTRRVPAILGGPWRIARQLFDLLRVADCETTQFLGGLDVDELRGDLGNQKPRGADGAPRRGSDPFAGQILADWD